MPATIEIVAVDVETVAEGYRVSKLLGSDVINNRKETIGTVDDFIMSGSDDCIQFAVLQVGGFLGLGGHRVAVEFGALTLDLSGGERKFILPGATKDELKKLPEFQYRA
jgi:sporulation protein YlmC with PRC-barrel domain